MYLGVRFQTRPVFRHRNKIARWISSSYTGRKHQCDSQQKSPAVDEEPVSKCPPSFPSSDWLGPADKRSNLRRMIYRHPEHETEAERMYREQRQATHEWNHQFWSQQNEKFIKAKEEFVKKRLDQKKRDTDSTSDEGQVLSGIKQILNADEMAEFYQQFLKDNRKTLREYNREWYYRNFSLLAPAMKASWQRLIRLNKR